MTDIVNVAGLKEIKCSKEVDEYKLETAEIMFQVRLLETVDIDRTVLIKGFSIFNGEETVDDEFFEDNSSGGTEPEFGYFDENFNNDYI